MSFFMPINSAENIYFCNYINVNINLIIFVQMIILKNLMNRLMKTVICTVFHFVSELPELSVLFEANRQSYQL